MRRIMIETRSPWLHRGYMVVGAGRDGWTRLRYEAASIDDPAKAENRREEILKRDQGAAWIGITEVRR